jgi:hypothetical protein
MRMVVSFGGMTCDLIPISGPDGSEDWPLETTGLIIKIPPFRLFKKKTRF